MDDTLVNVHGAIQSFALPRSPVTTPLAFAVVFVFVAAPLLLLPKDGQAQEPRLIAEILEAEDANDDGFLDRDEAPVAILTFFDSIDGDGDGLVDSYEASRWDARRFTSRGARDTPRARAGGPPSGVGTVVELIRYLDRNGDDQLSVEELPPKQRSAFGRLDIDQNGFIDLGDAEKIDASRRANEAAPEFGARGGRTLQRIVELMDTDGDGVLQRREAPLRLQRSWETFDRNGDGAIDMQEAKMPVKQPADDS